ncbi:hypothetical protein [Anaerocolumna sp.]|uniref:hypothetical protein n=1 Tax=Anaerocolumna sp. TaxID=2041569 RepID=UPI0028AC419B|nr:hypothetical protein [Anaerocolumna sp.]
MEITFEYLNKLLSETNSKRKQFVYSVIDETDAEIAYMNSKKDLCIGRQCGLMNELRLQQFKVREQPQLRKGSKNYLRIVKKDNRIAKIDSFINGRIDVVFLPYYETDMRYLFPFFNNGGSYPTYTYVTVYVDGMVSEEYRVNSHQIVYERYEKKDTNKVLYSRINYVPNGTHKVLDSEKGIIEYNSSIIYTRIEGKTWMDD